MTFTITLHGLLVAVGYVTGIGIVGGIGALIGAALVCPRW